MNTNALIRISGMILLATAVSLVIVVLIYALQHYQAVASLATVSWNG